MTNDFRILGSRIDCPYRVFVALAASNILNNPHRQAGWNPNNPTDTHDIWKILTSTDQKTGHLGHPINTSETIQSEGINQSRQCQMRKTKSAKLQELDLAPNECGLG